MLATRLEDLLGLYKSQVDLIEILEEQLKGKKEELRKLLHEVIPDVLAEYGTNEVKVGNHWFRMKNYVSPKINEEKYNDALDWIEQSGYGTVKTNCIIPLAGQEEIDELNGQLDGWTRIYERKIHHKTLESAIRKMVENDVSIPNNLITVTIGNFCKIEEV